MIFRSRRFTAIVIALAFVVIEGILRRFDCGVSDQVLLVALALVGGHVAGDTVRASSPPTHTPERT